MRRQTPIERARAARDTLASDAASARSFAERLAREAAPIPQTVPANDNDQSQPSWRHWGNGDAAAPCLIAGKASPRRANAFFAERRPEFLLNRASGRLEAFVVHDGREIASHED
ncbi:MAG: hypothetical protein AAFX39_01485 [Pseudomonadota bacterium]